MIKVYQTIIDRHIGNCMQAAIASLFEKSLEEVPNFKALKEMWFSAIYEFVEKQGYEFEGTLYNNKLYLKNKLHVEGNNDRFPEIKEMTGVNGFFFATVYSPKYYNPNDESPATHAVIIDKNFNIVHDPNPNYKDIINYPEVDVVGYNGIINIFMINEKDSCI